jgi:hypothetical protein
MFSYATGTAAKIQRRRSKAGERTQMTRKGQGIELTGRNEEQPTDRERAQDPSSPRQDAEQQVLREQPANRDQPGGPSAQDDKQRIQHKQGGHHLTPGDDEPAMDDTDRNTDKIIKPSRIHGK